MGAKTILTLGEFEQLPDDDMKHELDEGELITMSPTNKRHGRLQMAILRLLDRYTQERGAGEVYSSETGFVLSRKPAIVRVPDVAFLSSERPGRDDEFIEGAPDIAVEVLSPSDKPGDVKRKIKQYLQYGSKAVWVVYPHSRKVEVHKTTGVCVLQGDQLLEALDILPGFSASVRKLFE